MNETRKEPLKAYQNPGFLHGKDARVIRMLSEYLEPASRLKWQHVKDTIVFFGSARVLPREVSEKRLADLRARLSEASGQSAPASDEIARAAGDRQITDRAARPPQKKLELGARRTLHRQCLRQPARCAAARATHRRLSGAAFAGQG